MIFVYLSMVLSAAVLFWSIVEICWICKILGNGDGDFQAGVKCPRPKPPFDWGSSFARPEIEGSASSFIP
jgi:hypothetical protein